MVSSASVQLSKIVDITNCTDVMEEAERIFRYWYDGTSWNAVGECASMVMDMFGGRLAGYHACDTEYHDLSHTMSVVLATARIADGVFLGHGPYPADLTRDLFIAALLHDVGYIRHQGEEDGTGARFTSGHVVRSADFARIHAASSGSTPEGSGCDGEREARLIMATGLRDEFESQAWVDSTEREAGAVLGSADLVGQMGDRAYLEKLLFLYREFVEAGFPGYETEFDMLRKTKAFYEATRNRLDRTLGGLRHAVRRHFLERYGIDRDLYDEAITRQMEYLQSILDDESTNFRKKLKRTGALRDPEAFS